MKRLFTSLLVAVSLIGLGIAEVKAAESVSVEVGVSEPQVSSGHGYLKVSCPSDGVVYHFQVYSITGRLEKSFALSDGVQQVSLPQGCYIVRCEKWSKKVIVN